ncbi:hypothetical protein MAR_014818 [Mya arenaria]|uniref:Uncharacterized protein n=1 Tax=Mya arenaria TaxID=6604 RepID=A0ABY7FI58_MYAAR|nr:hypothetical protein MAR_014818 [Mya arenaria]
MKILQQMCQSGMGWNYQLPVSDEPKGNCRIKDLKGLDNVHIPRCLIPNEFNEDTIIELDHFSDASSYGYGQCSYIRLVNKDSVHCALLIGKARVAPLTVVTIPRLELTAAVLSVTMITPELQLGDPEVRSARSLHNKTSKHANPLTLLERFSYWNKRDCKDLQTVLEGHILQLLKNVAKRTAYHKANAIDALSSSTTLPKSNSLYPLDPVLQNGVLRIGTRLRNADLPKTCIYPIILLKNGHVTRLIIYHPHKNIKHQGRGFTINKLRCLGYWGGVWERQIRTIRNVLNSVLLLCPGRLDDASLRTFFTK